MAGDPLTLPETSYHSQLFTEDSGGSFLFTTNAKWEFNLGPFQTGFPQTFLNTFLPEIV
jgi:hypothetical protein